jgi:hypothetical protein
LGAEVGTQLEFWTLERLARYVVFLAILSAIALWARWRTVSYAASADNRVQFEDIPPGEVFALDLRRDGAWSGDQAYVDTIETGWSTRDRLKLLGIGAIALMTTGFLYEQIGEWRDHKRFPQIGRSVNIGGRSLNIDCAGAGAPTVVLEGTHGWTGY